MTCEEGCDCGSGPTRVVELPDGTVIKIWEGPAIDLTAMLEADPSPSRIEFTETP